MHVIMKAVNINFFQPLVNNTHSLYQKTRIVNCFLQSATGDFQLEDFKGLFQQLLLKSLVQGRIQDFFRRGCTRLLLYFNTNKPRSFFLFFFFCRITVVLENRRSSHGGVRIPCTLHQICPCGALSFENSLNQALRSTKGPRVKNMMQLVY